MSSLNSYLKFLEDLGLQEIPVLKESQPVPEKTKSTAVEPVSEKIPQIDLANTFNSMRTEVAGCTACSLHETRNNTVFGEGNISTDLMFIGEGPGFDEDAQGKPFVGKAGELLTKIINAIELSREDVFISNIIKCRPPQNRDPLPEEISACRHFIEKQIEIINPKIICTLGRHSTQALLGTNEGITKIRGTIHHYKDIMVIPTFHPAYLLRNASGKKPVWQDMQLIRDYLKEHSDIFERSQFGKNNHS